MKCDIVKACFHYGCAALRVASDSERYVAICRATCSAALAIKLTIADYRSQRAAQRSAAVVETGPWAF